MRGPTLKWSVLLLAVALALTFLFAGGCGDNDEEKGTPTAAVGDSTGVTDTEIKIGTLLPLTGTAAAWGIALSGGMKAYFDYINDQGGLYGRKITLIVGDSQYTGSGAAESGRKMVDQDKVFAFQGNLGTEAESGIYQYLEERGIPDMYILSGASKWTVPALEESLHLPHRLHL